MDGLQLRSLATKEGELQLSLMRVPVMEPGPDDVLVRIDATPINPSDIGLLFGAADMRNAKFSGHGDAVKVVAPIPETSRRAMAGRAGQSLPVGNEGAGEVVKAGANAQDLLGKTVAILGGAMYAQYRTLKASDCLLLPAGTTATEGASCFVNPLTALGMTETMRREGHTALIHTAAASRSRTPSAADQFAKRIRSRICVRSEGVARVISRSNRSDSLSPTAATISLASQPAKHRTRARPS